jgi:hypothetical protein
MGLVMKEVGKSMMYEQNGLKNKDIARFGLANQEG